VQPPQDGCHNPPVFDPLTFSALCKGPSLKLVPASPHGLDKQRRFCDDPLPLFGVAPLVVAIELGHLPGGQGLRDQMAAEKLCMLGVGARQGRQHPAGRPTGDLPLAQRIEDLIRERLHERQPAAHPAQIPAELPGDLPKGPSKAASKLIDERCLLDGLPGSLLGSAQYPHDGLILLARPDISQHRVLPAAAHSLNPQVAVNENKLPTLARHGPHRGALPMALDGVGQPMEIPWPANPALAVAQNQSMEFHLFHEADSTRLDHPESIEYSLCNHQQLSSKPRKRHRFSRLTRPSLQSHRGQKGPVDKCPNRMEFGGVTSPSLQSGVCGEYGFVASADPGCAGGSRDGLDDTCANSRDGSDASDAAHRPG